MNPVCRTGPESVFYPTWTALQHHIRSTHPPTCPREECSGRIFSSQKGLRSHLRIHEQRDLENVLSEHEDGNSEEDEPPRKRRRGGEVGRDWKCEVEGCTKDFKSVRVTCAHLIIDPDSRNLQKKALTTHHTITHLGRRDFVCTVEKCGRAFGYKHILQRHQARGHGHDRAEAEEDEDCEHHADADGESSEAERPRPKKQKTGRAQPPNISIINEITGVAYEERTARTPAPLRCPHPAMEGLSFTLSAESLSMWSDTAPCEYVFGRAYDLRRHLRAMHGVDLGKEIVDSWARKIRG